jgi:hypothetical protein
MDRFHARSRVLIDDDCAIGRELYADALEAELGGIRLAAGCEQHEVGLLVRAVGVAHLEAVGVLDDFRRLAAEVDLEAFVRQLLGDALAEIGVEAAQQALTAVGKRGLDAEPMEDGRKFQCDVAAADHQRTLGQPRKMECLVRRDGVLMALDRRHHRPRAGSDEDVLRAVAPAVDLHGVRIDHGGAAA